MYGTNYGNTARAGGAASLIRNVRKAIAAYCILHPCIPAFTATSLHPSFLSADCCHSRPSLTVASLACRSLQKLSLTMKRLTAILTHLSAHPPSAAASTAHYRLQPFHTRSTLGRVTRLTDAHLAISRLPASLPLSSTLPVSPPFSTYSSVWSSIVSPSSSATAASSFKPIIPPQSAADAGKLTVVLDMDECLLHSTFDDTLPSTAPPGDLTASPPPTALQPPYRHPTARYLYNITFKIGNPAADEQRVYVSFRPYLLPFLAALHRRFEVILFTSALPIYAAPILAYLSSSVQALGGGSQPLFRQQLYRASTVPLHSFQYVKDIRRLGRDMRRIVIVDNNPLAMLATPDNALLVPDWNGGDQEVPEVLREVVKFVGRVDEMTAGHGRGGGGGGGEKDEGDMGDVRPLLRHSLKFREQLEAAGIDFAANGIE